MQPEPSRTPVTHTFDAVVVGAGFAGLYMLHRLHELGLRARLFEAGGGVGGTWFWNRYPGARCDVHSVDYSYSFSDELQQEWEWSERYSGQAEILRYLEHVVDRFGLRDDIQLSTRVLSATYDDADTTWTVATDRGDVVRTRWCIFATGCLSDAQVPDFLGLDAFAGETYHTGHWPDTGADLAGRRVAVIGTGSSGMQVVPAIAADAGELYVFQRTANYCVPARNSPANTEAVAALKARYRDYRRAAKQSPTGVPLAVPELSALDVDDATRRRIFEEKWAIGGTNAFNESFHDLRSNPVVNEMAAEFIRSKIREIVHDPATAELLCPKDHAFASRRLCVENGYLETFNRPHVHLVDIKHTGIDEIVPTGIRVGDTVYEVDVIVFATGFDAFTGALSRIDVRGSDGVVLADEWKQGPAAYLGLMAAGFPNMFMITGPGSPSVLSNVVMSIEQHVEFVSDLVAHADATGCTRVDVDRRVQDDWLEHVNAVGQRTLLTTTRSWYNGGNVEGKPQQFVPYAGGVGTYAEICEFVRASGYPGFVMS